MIGNVPITGVSFQLSPSILCSNGFYPIWVRRCSLRMLTLLNVLPHNEWLHSFVSLWMKIWLMRLLFEEKLLSHVSNLKVFASAWVWRCWPSLPFHVKTALHSAHSNGFAPLWLRRCMCQVCGFGRSSYNILYNQMILLRYGCEYVRHGWYLWKPYHIYYIQMVSSTICIRR